MMDVPNHGNCLKTPKSIILYSKAWEFDSHSSDLSGSVLFC